MRAARRRPPQGQGPRAVNKQTRQELFHAAHDIKGDAGDVRLSGGRRRRRQPVPAARAHARHRQASRWRWSTSTSMRCAPSSASMRAPTSPQIADGADQQAARGDRRVPGRTKTSTGRTCSKAILARRWRRASRSRPSETARRVRGAASERQAGRLRRDRHAGRRSRRRSRRPPPARRRTAAPPRAPLRPRSGAAASAAARSRRAPRSAQRVSTRSTMRRLSRVAPPGSPMKPSFAHRLERLAERRDRSRPAGRPCRRARGSRRRAGRARCRLTRASGMSASSASASSNSSTLPDSSARRTRPAVSWPLSRRWRISGRISVVRRVGGERDGRLLAGFLGDALGAILGEPVRAR